MIPNKTSYLLNARILSSAKELLEWLDNLLAKTEKSTDLAPITNTMASPYNRTKSLSEYPDLAPGSERLQDSLSNSRGVLV